MMAKEILIVSNYFPPETGAASNRIFLLAEILKQYNYSPKVVSPLPNYPNGKIFSGYRRKLFFTEIYKGIKVDRLLLLASNSTNKIIRLLSMLSFSLNLFFFIILKKTAPVYIIQCSPLLVGFFAVIAAKLKGKNIILNVSDLWPRAGLEMGILNKGWYYDILLYMESYIYNNSDKIMGQSKEILTHVKSNLSKHEKPLLLYRNFPVFDRPKIKSEREISKFKIVYAGLLGVAQGIESIIKNINLPKGFELHIYGNGPMSSQVKDICKENSQLFYHGLLKREELHETLVNYDATLIPLKNRIYGSVPSKIFEYSKLGLPIIYFSDGEGADIVEKFNLGITQRQIDYNLLEIKLQQLSKNEIELPKKEHIQKTAYENFNVYNQFKNLQKKLFYQ